MRGCFDRDGIIGTLELKSFILKIKGLESGFDFKEQISFKKWKLNSRPSNQHGLQRENFKDILKLSSSAVDKIELTKNDSNQKATFVSRKGVDDEGVQFERLKGDDEE